MSYKDILNFLVASEEIDEPDMVSFELERLMAAFRLKHFCLFHHPRPVDDIRELVLVSRWPDGWAGQYIQRKYISVDPTVRHLFRATGPYRWDEALASFSDSPIYTKMQDMMAAAEKFGLKQGAVFPVHGRNGLQGALTVSGDEVDMSATEMALMQTVATAAWNRMTELRSDPRRPIVTPLEPSMLTPRAMQAVSMLAEGMTSAEIASVLGVSIHTVDWHFNTIQQKLGARNRYQTLAMCMRGGLLA